MNAKPYQKMCRRLEALALLLIFLFPFYTGVADAALRDRYETPVKLEGDSPPPPVVPKEPKKPQETKSPPAASKTAPVVVEAPEPGAGSVEDLPDALKNVLDLKRVTDVEVQTSPERMANELAAAHMEAVISFIGSEMLMAEYIDIIANSKYARTMDDRTFQQLTGTLERNLASTERAFRRYNTVSQRTKMAMEGWDERERNVFMAALSFFAAVPAEAAFDSFMNPLNYAMNSVHSKIKGAITTVKDCAKKGYNWTADKVKTVVDYLEAAKKEHNVIYGVGLVVGGVVTFGIALSAAATLTATAPLAVVTIATVQITTGSVSGALLIGEGTVSLVGGDTGKFVETTAPIGTPNTFLGGSISVLTTGSGLSAVYNGVKVGMSGYEMTHDSPGGKRNNPKGPLKEVTKKYVDTGLASDTFNPNAYSEASTSFEDSLTTLGDSSGGGGGGGGCGSR